MFNFIQETSFPEAKRSELILMLNDADPAVIRNIAIRKLNVSEDRYEASWSGSGSLGLYLVAAWEDKERTVEHFIEALEEENRHDIANFLRQQNGEETKKDILQWKQETLFNDQGLWWASLWHVD